MGHVEQSIVTALIQQAALRKIFKSDAVGFGLEVEGLLLGKQIGFVAGVQQAEEDL